MTTHRSVAPVLPALLLALVATGAGAPDAQTTGTGDQTRATVSAVLDGGPAEDHDASDPLVLRPDRDLEVEVAIGNDTGQDLRLRSVRLQGHVLGVPFMDYNTRVDHVVPAGETINVSYALDVSQLNEAAVGLLPAQVTVLDEAREPVAESTPLVVDARGSLTSAYGLFGILVALMTAMLLGAALVRLARGTLPENRWYRAVRFAVPGAGLGLTATVTLSVFRVLVPDTGSWLTIVVCCGLAGLVLGFLTPSPHPARTSARPVPAHVLPPRHARGSEAPPAAEQEAGTVDPLWADSPAQTADAAADVPGQRPTSAPDEGLPAPRAAAER